jgi:hypothetical protein
VNCCDVTVCVIALQFAVFSYQKALPPGVQEHDCACRDCVQLIQAGCVILASMKQFHVLQVCSTEQIKEHQEIAHDVPAFSIDYVKKALQKALRAYPALPSPIGEVCEPVSIWPLPGSHQHIRCVNAQNLGYTKHILASVVYTVDGSLPVHKLLARSSVNGRGWASRRRIPHLQRTTFKINNNYLKRTDSFMSRFNNAALQFTWRALQTFMCVLDTHGM